MRMSGDVRGCPLAAFSPRSKCQEMSKPCIVCVDEEPARLERLAALIEQEFGETCQLRRFASSEECFEALLSIADASPPLPSVPLLLCDESMHHLTVRLEQHEVRLANVVLVRDGWEDEPLVDAIESLLAPNDDSLTGSAAHRHAVEKKNASLEALHQIGVALASSFDIDSILRQITRAAMLLLGEPPVDVFYAGSRKISSQPRWLPTKSASGHLSEEDRTALARRVAALADDDGQDSASPVFESRRSDGLLDMGQVIPIAQRENVLGLIVVEPGRSLSQEDLGLLSILSLQAATALHNIHLTQERIHFERLSAVGRMIGSVVHDFRSPLTAVRGYAGMLASLNVSEEHRREYARLIVEECDRLGGLTDELLELTRGSRTKSAIRRMDLDAFFRDLEPSLEAQFMDSEVSLKVDLEYRGPVALDSDRMTRAILNVAANARQAIHGAGSFAVRSQQDLEHVVLEFEDTGCGIPEDIRHRVFEPFFSYGKTQGIGLGMCIIQRIVQEHGGETVLDSEPGVGTTVKFLLPLERVGDEESSKKVQEIEHSAAGPTRGRRS